MHIPTRRAIRMAGVFRAARATIVIFAFTLPAHGQTEQSSSKYVPTLTFDVASVRQSKPANSITVSGGFRPHSSVLEDTNFSVENLIMQAYGLHGFYQLTGIPAGFRWTFFNVQAKSDSAADERLGKLSNEQAQSEQQHMLQMLLADRFKMKAHWEAVEVPVLNLLVKDHNRANAAMKIPLVVDDTDDPAAKKLPAIYQRGDSDANFSLIGNKCSMEQFIEILSGQFGRPVLDKTGLKGIYDFKVTYHGQFLSETDAGSTNPVPPLDEALERQLGLKVEHSVGPLTRLVVDHLEKPTDN